MKEKDLFRTIADYTYNWEDLIGSDGRLIWVSRAVERITGYTVEECFAMEHYPYPILLEEDREKTAREIHAGLVDGETGRDSEGRIRRKDGTTRWISVSWQPVYGENGSQLGIRSSIVDVTERKQADELLLASEDTFRTVVENSLAGIFVIRDGKFVFVNRRAAEINGFENPEEMIGLPFWKQVHPDHREMVRERAGRRQSGEAVPEHYEFKGLRKDGVPVWVEVRAVLADFKGEPAIVGNIVDIDERKQAEETLRASEESYRRLFESIRDAILVADRDRRIIDCNTAFTELFGYCLDEIRGQRTSWVYAREEEYTALGEKLQGREKKPNFFTTIRYRKKSGEEFPGETNVFHYRNEAGETIGYIGLIRDISEREMLEEQLRQAQKMEAIGRLAGGVAHDFNNLLTGILGNTDLALMADGSDETVRDNLLNIRYATERAASLTAQLLAYSRKQVLTPRVFDLNLLVNHNRKMLGRLIGEDISLQVDLDPKTGCVQTDPALLEQVIMNLAVNARDAMPGGGTLTIRTRNERLGEKIRAHNPEVRPGKYVELTVSDDGIGMDAETLEHIFEPFFTTKEVGKGTGLGLSSVYGTVRQSGGHVFVESEQGRGTAFRIYLPQVQEDPDPESFTASRLPFGDETVMIVEDEESVRKMVRTVLERHGYRVIEVDDSREGLALLEDGKSGEVNLLIIDIVMPGMNGRDLARRITGRYGNLKVLYISGYDESVHRGRRTRGSAEENVPGGNNFLPKPFSPGQLLQKIRTVLDAGPWPAR
jgi:PAS domain S-box-containing protein